MAWLWVDSDHAADLYIKNVEDLDANFTSSLGRLAVYPYVNTPWIKHPKVQALFVEDGKWIDFLAERFPEYVPLKSARK